MQTTDARKEKRSGRRRRKRSSFGVAVEIWRYRIISILLLAAPALLLDNLMSALVDSSGAPITTANTEQMFSWRLPVYIILSVAMIMVFIVFEILGQIHLSNDILRGQESHVFREIGKGFKSVKHFLSPKGLLIALFITVAVPLCGIGFSISLTESFRMPNFIMSVIFSKPLLAILYIAGIAALVIVAIRWIFAIHAMLLDDMKAGDALKRSVSLVKANWKDLFKKFIIIIIYSALILIASHFVCKVLPDYIMKIVGQDLPAGQVSDVTKGGLTAADGSVM